MRRRGPFHYSCQVLARRLLSPRGTMITLTRLNNQVIALNPDHIQVAEATPETCLSLVGGEKVLVRETLEEVITAIRRGAIRPGEHVERLSLVEGDRPRTSALPVRPSGLPRRGER